MKNRFFKIIKFPITVSKNGSLVMFQNASTGDKNPLPFDIKRVLVIRDVKNNDVRGGHTHHKTRQMLFAVNGACTVSLDSGKEKDTVVLDAFDTGVLLEPYVWHTMENFRPNTILLVLTDTEYDEKDYIRNYDDFLNFVK